MVKYTRFIDKPLTLFRKSHSVFYLYFLLSIHSLNVITIHQDHRVQIVLNISIFCHPICCGKPQ